MEGTLDDHAPVVSPFVPASRQSVTASGALRARFPVFERGIAYLNAGTNGPVPANAARAASAAVERQSCDGRSGSAFFEELVERPAQALRAAAARWLGCEPGEVALTRSTTDGINVALAAFPLGRGDEVLTSDQEHPGLLAPLLQRARDRGFSVRTAPLRELPNAVGPRTRLIACSHVSWVSGQMAPLAALADLGVPTLFDGAQALGALAVDVRGCGCTFYAAPAQKWLCGPNGIGFLYVRGDLGETLAPPWPGYQSLANPHDPSALQWHSGARRFDTLEPVPHDLAWALAALEELEAEGRTRVLSAGAALAEQAARSLREEGLEVVPRGPSTLVSVRLGGDAAQVVQALAAQRVIVRDVPGWGLLRASFGAWNDESDLARLLEGLRRWRRRGSAAL